MGKIEVYEKMKKIVAILAVLLMNSVLFAGIATADSDMDFIIPEIGGAVAHCDLEMSDCINAPIPTGDVEVVWNRCELPGEKAGSKGLGFSSNGKIAAATYTGLRDNLVIYDYDGNHLWSSGRLLNLWACGSAPMVDVHGRVIACDNKVVIMVDPLDVDGDGKILEWKTKLVKGGLPISPVITEDGTLVIATKGGPIYAFDSKDGSLLAYKYLNDNLPARPIFEKLAKLFKRFNIENRGGYFETINTPCVNGNRAYVSTQYSKDRFLLKRARLYAIDIDPGNPNVDERLKTAWYYEFDGPSGASPLLIGNSLYFDGGRSFLGKPKTISITDMGDDYKEEWKSRIPNPIDSSLARDPRGGFWIVDAFGGCLIHQSTEDGSVIEEIDTTVIVDEPGRHKPCSVITMYGNETRPILINAVLSIEGRRSSCYVIAVDLEDNNNLLWKVKISDGKIRSIDFPFGQYPVLLKNGEPRIVFTTVRGGAWAIGRR